MLLQLLPLSLALVATAKLSSFDDHPVQKQITNSNKFPTCVPCTNVPDGPIAGNGDIGVVLSGTNTSLGVYIGKNDFWGWPGQLLWHGSFQHLSPGYLTVSLQESKSAYDKFESTMQLSNGTIAAEINADQFGLKIENLQVLSNSNTIVAEVVPVCNDKSQKTVHLDFTLQTDNPYSLPMEVAAGTHDASLIKHAVPRKFVPPMLVSCSPRQILYNSIRTWAVQNGTNLLSVLNSTSSESGVLCLGVEGDSVLIKFCSDVEDKFAHNKETGLIENTSGQCVGIEYGGENSTECPKESFPPPNPPCYTSQYTFKVLERRDCKKETQFVSPFWAINEDGFMRSANANQDANDDDEKCMTAPGPMIDNAVAVVARIVNNHEVVMWNVGKDKISIESVGNEVTCNKPVSLKIGVASARNVNGGDEDDYKSSPIELARENSNNGELKDREATNEWWKEFWMSSRVSLGKWSEVESFYYNMLYSFRASNEVGNVSPGLWGPFCTTVSLCKVSAK